MDQPVGLTVVSLVSEKDKVAPALLGAPLAAENLKLTSWDPAVFATDILQTQAGIHRDFEQTSKGLTVAYGKIMSSIQSYFDVTEFEPNMAPHRLLEDKKKLYQFTTEKNNDDYPPHLALVPKDVQVTQENLFQETQEGKDEFNIIFNVIIKKMLGIAGGLWTAVRPQPEEIKNFKGSASFAELMAQHRAIRGNPDKPSKSSVGDLDGENVKLKWFSDEIFAQQNFTGTNPTTIEKATQWVTRFKAEAKRQKLEKTMLALLERADEDSLYVQDCSYFREAFGIKDQKATMADTENGFLHKTSRWACAAVTLFQLSGEGKLHPLAIIVDYKGSMEDSITIFNQRLDANEAGHDQENDWPWRYAKTCSQVSDWIRHELAIHLVNTHLIEEGIIVASQRTLPSSHILFRILSPHWDKTLSLNASARKTLVPSVVIPIVGVTDTQAKFFINYCYETFDFQGNYIPTDLKRRGFPVEKLGDYCCRCDLACDLDKEPAAPCTVNCPIQCHQKCEPKFKNYTYARNMKLMWTTLRNFVAGFLKSGGFENNPAGNKKVVKDQFITSWVKEIRSPAGANQRTFPEIKTVDELIDAVTMCIHIASPQHTAVNYLQQYYLSFVVNKPPALCAALPKNLDTLMKYKEADLIKALPVARNRDAEWLLASHLPALLSQTVSKDLNLVAYAVNVYCAAKLVNDQGLMTCTEKFCRELWVLGNTFADGDKKRLPKKGVFTQHSDELDPGLPKYSVMDPVVTAVSVLI